MAQDSTSPGGTQAAGARGPAGNAIGRRLCLTLLTPIRPGWALLVRAALRLGRRLPAAHRHVLQFDFIHFARWAVVTELPFNGAPQRRDRLRYAHLFFESNFDGPWQDYIDAFAYCIPTSIRLLWGRGFAFPAPPPAEPLKRWIARNSLDDGSYYCAYPEASTRMVHSALAAADGVRALAAASPSLDPDEFRTRYERLLTDLQDHL